MTTDTIGTTMAGEIPVPRDRPGRGYLIAGAALLLFGAWTSLRYSFGNWGPDADIAAQVVIWQGVLQHGLAFIPSWSFTPDNWLFSLTPIDAVIYTVFGTKPVVVVGVGWLIFLVSVGITTRLSHHMAGWRAAVPVALVLLFSNFDSLGGTGFLSYPVTHNVSMAWALLALLVAYRAVALTSPIDVALAGLCVFIDTVSDPWAGPAIALPIIVASLALAGLHWRRKQGWYCAALFFSVAIAFLAARTRLFGVLDFLPASSFDITDAPGLVANVGWMFRVVAIMFNIVPFAGNDNVFATVAGFLLFATVLVAACVLAIGGLRDAPVGRQLVVGAAVLSIGGVGVAFLLLKIDGPTEILGRFLPNLHYFGALLAGTAVAANWQRLHLAARGAFVAYALLLVASGLASNPGLWTGQSAQTLLTPKENDDVKRLAGFLLRNKLTYGYGPYWGAEALAMNWMTKGRVTVRAVGFDADHVNGTHPQTSRLFFSADDEPAGTAETFMIINNDGENCPSVDACVATAIRQFGEPSRRLTFEESVVLIWPHPIVSKITDY